MARFLVKIGDDFEIDAVEVDLEVVERAISAKGKLDDAATRNCLAAVLLVSMIGALAIAWIMHFVEGDYGSLQAVWMAVSLPLGWIGKYYFEKG